MTPPYPDVVYVVDDNQAIRDSISALLRGRTIRSRAFATSDSFLQSLDGLDPGCILLDIQMPAPDGLTVLAEVIARGAPMAVVIMTGHADVSLAVRTLHQGAVDFIEKPILPAPLFASLERAALALENVRRRHAVEERRLALTAREREVLQGIVEGSTSREIAASLGISHRTVETHRASIMDKLDVGSLAELVRVAGIGVAG